jgi:hypothetical protein
MSQFGGMQVLAQYKSKLSPKFLGWYFKEFTNSRMVYLHWPVECKSADDEHYHWVVVDRGGAANICRNTPLTQDTYDHTWHRNTNACAIALGGFSGATTSDLGSECATPSMVMMLTHAVAEACIQLKAPVGNVLSHGEAADNVDQGPNPPYSTPYDPYGPLSTWERWDLHCWVVPGSNKLYAPKMDKPKGALWLPDYVRGEAILLIQEETKKAWS